VKILFIGGTGNISSAVSRFIAAGGLKDCKAELHHLNRGISAAGREIPPGVISHRGDIGSGSLPDDIRNEKWDCVVNWVAFTAEEVERDVSLFRGKTSQYIFISSASAYQKPLSMPVITESTPLCNPFWDYSRNKIACEDRLLEAYRHESFPVTIVRPSLTYDTVIPVAIGGFKEYTIADRILKGKKVIVHGDGKSLWTVTHADDFAAGFAGLIGNIRSIGHAFHITSDEILSWDQIYGLLASALGRKADIIHIASDFICSVEPSLTGNLLGDKAESVIFDNSKIKAFVPGFKAVIPFSEGIKRTLAWFDADNSRKIVLEQTGRMMDRIIEAYSGN
jgi:nucleoside-diphosphate-sugar epimerase